MEPEIARRCTACGAAVRGGSFFCPQCGEALKAASSARTGAGLAIETPETPARRTAGTEQPPQPQEQQNQTSAHAPSHASAAGAESKAETGREATKTSDDNRPRARVIPLDAAEEDESIGRKRQRLAASARDAVEERLAPRVEKLRHASNVMLEEANYDPSLRFVLVALALVLLSLLILLLNYLLG